MKGLLDYAIKLIDDHDVVRILLASSRGREGKKVPLIILKNCNNK